MPELPEVETTRLGISPWIIGKKIKKVIIRERRFRWKIQDDLEKKLFCARDRFGLAPFYYLWKNNEFLFASELKSILNSGYSNGKVENESFVQ